MWQISVRLATELYELTGMGPFAGDFGLRDQLRRAIVSVSSNIVEGFEKNNNNEFVRYLKIAKGSLGEVRSQMYIACSIGYVSTAKHAEMDMKLQELAKQLGVLIRYLESIKRLGNRNVR